MISNISALLCYSDSERRANNSDRHSAADNNASDCNTAEMDMNAISTDSDMTVDLIDFTDGIVELATVAIWLMIVVSSSIMLPLTRLTAA